jgi:hypothetical protein
MSDEVRQRIQRATWARWRKAHAEFLAGGMSPRGPCRPRPLDPVEQQAELARLQAAEIRHRNLERLLAGEG